MRTLIVTLFCWGIHSLYAQHPVKIEQELLTQLRVIQYWCAFNDASPFINRHDSLLQANDHFLNTLLRYTGTVHATIGFDFYELEKLGLVIKTSDDGLFRIYSWDTGMGNGEHVFDVVFQYKNGNKIFSQPAYRPGGDPGRWYSHIHSLITEDKVYYLAVYHGITSNRYSYQGIKAFCIDGNKLNDTTALIKTMKGVQNELGFEYDFLSVAKRPERPVKLIYFDGDEDRLEFAVVRQDGKVTRRFVTYQFTGKYFERINSTGAR